MSYSNIVSSLLFLDPFFFFHTKSSMYAKFGSFIYQMLNKKEDSF